LSLANTYNTLSDEELMQKSMQGHKPAFEILYNRYFDKLTWFAKQYVFDEQMAEDLVQEVFVKIIHQPELYDKDKKFSTWVYTITANRCKNVLRDAQNRKSLLMGYNQTEETFMQHQYDYTQLKQHIQNVVSDLNEKEKTLFVLRFEHEMPIKEISEITETPVGTIKSGIHYLLKKLANNLKAFTHE
jgi:RNA polymerase sigma-70 factor (ECF subfamily)